MRPKRLLQAETIIRAADLAHERHHAKPRKAGGFQPPLCVLSEIRCLNFFFTRRARLPHPRPLPLVCPAARTTDRSPPPPGGVPAAPPSVRTPQWRRPARRYRPAGDPGIGPAMVKSSAHGAFPARLYASHRRQSRGTRRIVVSLNRAAVTPPNHFPHRREVEAHKKLFCLRPFQRAGPEIIGPYPAIASEWCDAFLPLAAPYHYTERRSTAFRCAVGRHVTLVGAPARYLRRVWTDKCEHRLVARRQAILDGAAISSGMARAACNDRSPA